MNRSLSVLVILLVLTPSSLVAEDLRAGAARIDITPPTGHPMWGYASRHDAPSTGVLDRLHARALVLAVGKQKLALVSLDLGRAPTRDSVSRICKRLAKAGILHFCLVGSHTHHGPVLELDDWPTPKTSYVRQLEDKLAKVILAAHKQIRPAHIGVGSRQVNLNRNRHSRRRDKVVDPELLILKVEDDKGKVIAHAVNFAAHPTMLPSRLRQFSADFPGVLAEMVEKKTGAPCLFLQGAAGNLSPNPRKKWDYKLFGRTLGGEVLTLSRTIRCEGVKKPTLKIREHDFRFRSRLPLDNPIVSVLLRRAFFPKLIAFYEREYREGIRPHLTVALLNEEIGLVGVSGEFFCGHSLSLKRRARLKHVFFLGYCNDYHQYFPTIEAASEGGYGTEPFIAPASLGAGERIMNQALLSLYQMRGKLRAAPRDSPP